MTEFYVNSRCEIGLMIQAVHTSCSKLTALSDLPSSSPHWLTVIIAVVARGRLGVLAECHIIL